jgi:predicted ABC-type ATPase
MESIANRFQAYDNSENNKLLIASRSNKNLPVNVSEQNTWNQIVYLNINHD